MSEIKFKPVETAEDVRVLAALAKEIWEQHFTPIIGAAQVAYMVDKFQSEPAMTRQIAEGYFYRLICLDGVPVGYTGYHPEENRLFLSKLYLRKSCRKKGLARKALEFLCEVCRERGLKTVYLTVNRHNDDTIAVYKHLGFVTVKEQKADIGNGFYMDDYIMEYRVEP